MRHARVTSTGLIPTAPGMARPQAVLLPLPGRARVLAGPPRGTQADGRRGRAVRPGPVTRAAPRAADPPSTARAKRTTPAIRPIPVRIRAGIAA
jgi:hypothetical protein